MQINANKAILEIDYLLANFKLFHEHVYNELILSSQYTYSVKKNYGHYPSHEIAYLIQDTDFLVSVGYDHDRDPNKCGPVMTIYQKTKGNEIAKLLSIYQHQGWSGVIAYGLVSNHLVISKNIQMLITNHLNEISNKFNCEHFNLDQMEGWLFLEAHTQLRIDTAEKVVHMGDFMKNLFREILRTKPVKYE